MAQSEAGLTVSQENAVLQAPLIARTKVALPSSWPGSSGLSPPARAATDGPDESINDDQATNIVIFCHCCAGAAG
jgi:hypothetical protein